MDLPGLRIHIAGSAAPSTAEDLLASAHELVQTMTRHLIQAGSGLVVGVGGEPIGNEGLPCIFDWSILETVAMAPDPAPNWPRQQRGRFRVVASLRALEKVPDSRRAVWERCTARGDLELETSPAGWRMGGVIRALQVMRGDVLVALGGGAGVEHLAELYLDEGKPVIPINSALGSVNGDGNGGSTFIYGRAMRNVDAFFRLRDGAGGAGSRLSRLNLTTPGDIEVMASETISLIEDLRPSRAFYVRLQAKDRPDFESVERFFREVVDPVVIAKGFSPHEVGRDEPLAAFLNVEIFEGIHRAGLVIVDLTDLRPNCTMELGYALGRRRRVIVSAKSGTRVGFDQDKLPIYFWDEAESSEHRANSFRDWLERHFDMPLIVQ